MFFECRICKSNDYQENFIYPCKCKGTSKYVHKICLETWMANSINPLSKISCEICKHKYKYTKENKIKILMLKDTLFFLLYFNFICFIIGYISGYISVNILGYIENVKYYHENFIIKNILHGFLNIIFLCGMLAWILVFIYDPEGLRNIQNYYLLLNSIIIIIPGIFLFCLFLYNHFIFLYKKNLFLTYEKRTILNYNN